MQHNPLLSTKLYVPPPRAELVSRPRLVERLRAGLTRKLTLVSAPAGFGKTTLITEWLHSTAPAPAVAWLSLEVSDNDAVRFIRYLVAALQTINQEVGRAVEPLLGSPQVPALESLVTLLINDFAAIPQSFVFVLDDYHAIHLPAIHQAVEFLIEHQPPQMHLLLSTRQDPPLPLPRLRVGGQVTEIREQDLRFTPRETTRFLHELLGSDLDPNLLATLQARTEGWIAGLQLAALSMRGRSTEQRTAFVQAFSGSHRHVIDYLADEVLAQQPAETRQFLRQTSILERLCAPLCDTLTGRSDSATLLQQLEEANLFLVPLDERRLWYRYHRLFADVLRTDLDADVEAALHQTAARWFAEHELLSEAAEHALASGDSRAAVPIVAQAAGPAFQAASFTTLNSWLDALPEEALLSHGELATYRGMAAFFTGAFDEAVTYAGAAERCFSPGRPSPSQGRMLCLRAHVRLSQAAFEDAVRIAREATVSLSNQDLLFRSLTLNVLGQALEWQGYLVEAADAYRGGALIGQRAGNQVGALAALTNLLFSLNALGRRREALALSQQVAPDARQSAGKELSLAEGVYLAWSLLSYEGNHLDLAAEQISRVLPLCEQANISDAILWGLYIRAKIALARGDLQATRRICREGRQQATRLDLDAIHGARFAALEALVCLDEGDLVACGRLLHTAGRMAAAVRHHWQDSITLARCRLLLAQGQPGEAQALLSDLERQAQQGARSRTLLAIHTLQALAHHATGHRTTALDRLSAAVRQAAPEGYRRVFLNEGLALRRLLPQVRSQAPGFVDELLAAFGQQSPMTEQKAVQSTRLLEPLTEREIQILRLIAAGRSNPEIAGQLYLSLNTVKWHVKNRYGKLQVSNRVEAAARAQELKIL
jgi:LuxR family maltose regulon positive regulatory protein